jgi:hypothetical protein
MARLTSVIVTTRTSTGLAWSIGETVGSTGSGHRVAEQLLSAQLRRAVERSRARGRIALVLLDNLGIDTPKARSYCGYFSTSSVANSSWSIRPAYDPESNSIEWLPAARSPWRALAARRVAHSTPMRLGPPVADQVTADADRHPIRLAERGSTLRTLSCLCRTSQTTYGAGMPSAASKII